MSARDQPSCRRAYVRQELVGTVGHVVQRGVDDEALLLFYCNVTASLLTADQQLLFGEFLPAGEHHYEAREFQFN